MQNLIFQNSKNLFYTKQKYIELFIYNRIY